MDRDGNRSRPSAQKGVLLVFTALLLPVVFACAGLAVDLGNMYVHKSNLQNAVDSAALAGAAGYIAGGETAEDHPGANIMSDEYLKANLGREYQNLIVKDFQAQTVSGKTYYRVKVTQKSPVYFMTLLGLDPLTDVSADAVAQVGSAGSSSSGFGFKDLIVANHISDLGSIGPNYYYWWRDIFSSYLLGSYSDCLTAVIRITIRFMIQQKESLMIYIMRTALPFKNGITPIGSFMELGIITKKQLQGMQM